AFDAALALDDDRALAAPLVADLGDALGLGEQRRVLGPARLEQLGDARQTAGDVLRADDLARGLREQRAGADLLPVLDLDVGLLGHRVDRGAVAVLVLDDDLRVQITLVLDDLLARDLALGVALDAVGPALEDVLVAHRARHLGEDRVMVRIPRTQHRARRDVLALLDAQDRAERDRVTLDLAVLVVDHDHLPAALARDALAVAAVDDDQVGVAHLAAAPGLDLGLLDLLARRAADVERPHRELRAGLADRLRGDDADRQAG